jgi:hypothetical protein
VSTPAKIVLGHLVGDWLVAVPRAAAGGHVVEVAFFLGYAG